MWHIYTPNENSTYILHLPGADFGPCSHLDKVNVLNPVVFPVRAVTSASLLETADYHTPFLASLHKSKIKETQKNVNRKVGLAGLYLRLNC